MTITPDPLNYCLSKIENRSAHHPTYYQLLDPEDEKYSVEYIRREAVLIIRYVGVTFKQSFFNDSSLHTRDVRILRRWDLY